jgi:hypothetical protein
LAFSRHSFSKDEEGRIAPALSLYLITLFSYQSSPSESDDEFELELDEEFELELEEEFEFEFEELFEFELEDEFELELEELFEFELEDEFELELEELFEFELEDEFELELDEEFEFEFELLDRPLFPPFFASALKATMSSCGAAFLAFWNKTSNRLSGLLLANAGMTNEPAAKAVAARIAVSFFMGILHQLSDRMIALAF